ncbi:MAG TPA: hypothetical protein VNK24_06915 [Elusimicrobiota bacterium]|nr:hypothetical protein [Elusimicrobiota bacterium]
MKYFIYKDADISGPYDSEELRRLNADPDTLAYAEAPSSGGGKLWRPLAEILNFPIEDEPASMAALPPIPEKSLDEMIVDFDLDPELWSGGEARFLGNPDAEPPLDVFLDLIEIAPELGLPKIQEERPRPETPKEPAPETSNEAALLLEVARLRERLAALEESKEVKADKREDFPSSAPVEEPVPAISAAIPEPEREVSLAPADVIFEAPKTFPVLETPREAAPMPMEQEEPAFVAPQPAAAPEPKSGLEKELGPSAPQQTELAAAVAAFPEPSPQEVPAPESALEASASIPEAEPPAKSGTFESELQKVLGPASEISAFSPAPAPFAAPAPQPQNVQSQSEPASLFAATPGAGLSAVPSASEFTTGIFGTVPSFQAPIEPASQPPGSGTEFAAKPASIPGLDTAPTQPFAAAPAVSTQNLISELAPATASAPPGKAKAATKPKKKSPKGVYFILGGLIVAAAGGGFFLLTGGFNSSRPAPSPAPAASPVSAPPPAAPAQQAASPQTAQTQQQAPAPISPEAQAAIDLVKSYPLDGNRGTVAQWLQYSFTANPGDDNREEWTAGALSGASYEVQYRVVPGPQSSLPQSISYLFAADADRQTVQGANAAAKQLLSGGQSAVSAPQPQSAQPAPQQ